MKKMFKVMLLVLCAALLVAGSVLGTLAYLKSQTETVKNTFTVGKVAITLDEAKTDAYGVAVEGGVRIPNANDTAVGNEYKLIPGREYVKDPTIHVIKGSEPCYLFVEVVNEIASIEAGTTIATQMAAKGWVNLTGNVWYYNNSGAKIVDARNAAENMDFVIFENFKISGTADISAYAGKTITITGYAIQADGFATPEAAWTASGFGAPANP